MKCTVMVSLAFILEAFLRHFTLSVSYQSFTFAKQICTRLQLVISGTGVRLSPTSQLQKVPKDTEMQPLSGSSPPQAEGARGCLRTKVDRWRGYLSASAQAQVQGE